MTDESTDETRTQQWRCFHCDEVLETRELAADHFGARDGCPPACRIASWEGGLVSHIRRLERELETYRLELDPLTKAWYAREADLRLAATRAEERGYARGVREMRSQMEADLRRHGV